MTTAVQDATLSGREDSTPARGESNAAPCRRDDLIAHELDGEALIYDPLSADTHRLNATALFIWRHCDGRQGAELIALTLAEAFDIGASDARSHTTQTIDRFRECRLVAISP